MNYDRQSILLYAIILKLSETEKSIIVTVATYLVYKLRSLFNRKTAHSLDTLSQINCSVSFISNKNERFYASILKSLTETDKKHKIIIIMTLVFKSSHKNILIKL